MTDRALINEVCQIGIEGTAGVAVAASKKLLSTTINLRPDGNVEGFGPSGFKFDTNEVVGREFAVGDIEGQANYNDLAYLFASLVQYAGTPTMGTGTGGTSYTWTFTPDTDGTDTIKTITAEQGSSVRAASASYGVVNGLEISIDRNKVEISGDMIFQRLSDGITLTAAPTDVPQKPILPNQVDIYLDSTSATLGNTKLVRAFKASWKYGERQSTIWPLNSANASFGGIVEKKPTSECELEAEADGTAMAFLDNMRASTTKFLRIEALGATIHTGAGTPRYKLTIDMAVQVGDMMDFGDADEVKTTVVPLRMVHDATWGKAMTITLVNTVTF